MANEVIEQIDYNLEIVRNSIRQDRAIANWDFGLLQSHFHNIEGELDPFAIELIYNYWLEEGYTIATMRAIIERFKNLPGKRTQKLMHLTINPLYNISTALNTVVRMQRSGELMPMDDRNREYQNHYGYSLSCYKNIQVLDTRSKFQAAFSKLLSTSMRYYRQAEDNTITPDAYPVLLCLQELNIILAEGSVNQSVEMTLDARAELRIYQNILANDNIGEFLRHRPVVPYADPWMGRVDAMKSIQRWSDISIRIYNDLAENGESILLSVRLLDWNNDMVTDDAITWLGIYENQIKTYVNRYQSVTGVNLSADGPKNDQRAGVMPGILIRQQMLQTV